MKLKIITLVLLVLHILHDFNTYLTVADSELYLVSW